MCFVDGSLKRTTTNKNSVGGDDDLDRNIDGDDEDFDRRIANEHPPSTEPLFPLHSGQTADENEAKCPSSKDRLQCGHSNSTYKNNRTKNSSHTVETILPNVVWLEHILPCLDRSSWNALMEASKSIYMLAVLSKLAAEYQGRASTSTAQPPWPTNRSFQSKSGGQGQAIESIAMSHDGEFMACGSVIGSIDVWNLRTGKIQWKAKQSLSKNANSYDTNYHDAAEELAQRPNYFASRNSASRAQSTSASVSSSMQRRSSPLGSVLTFSQGGGYTLACGFENRVFVWDLKKELRRTNEYTSHADIHHQEITSDVTPSLPLHKEYNSYTPNVAPWRKIAEKQERRPIEPCYQTLEIECNHGTIYEVTYLGFSNTFGNSNTGPHRLVARYGKTAYIWTTCAGDSSPKFVLTHSIPLSSSRNQMVSNALLTKLAVSTNGGSSRRNNARQNEEGDSTVFTTNNKKMPDGKGIIHVWDLEEAFAPRNCRQAVITISNSCSTRIVAYPDHVVRGLEFLQATTSNCDDCLLVSASLQGEVKFWKKYVPTQIHPRDRYKDSSEGTNITAVKNTIVEERDQPSFVCVYQFQSPGKIFSLASWSSIPSSTDQGKILLAAGEARGQVRVWKLSTGSISTPCSSACEVSLGSCGKSGSSSKDSTKQQRLEECLSTEVGDHVHYDNIKLLTFTPDGRSLAVSRAYDAKIWFQTVWQ